MCGIFRVKIERNAQNSAVIIPNQVRMEISQRKENPMDRVQGVSGIGVEAREKGCDQGLS